MIKFWWRSGSRIRKRIRIRIQIRIATLVRRALTEVCTVPVLIVIIRAYYRADVLSYLFGLVIHISWTSAIVSSAYYCATSAFSTNSLRRRCCKTTARCNKMTWPCRLLEELRLLRKLHPALYSVSQTCGTDVAIKLRCSAFENPSFPSPPFSVGVALCRRGRRLRVVNSVRTHICVMRFEYKYK